MRGLKGRHAVITGAASGIGLASAERLAAEGCLVSGIDLRDPTEPSVFSEFAIADVANQVAVSEAFESITKARGAVDILVVAAGIDQCDTVPETAPEVWTRLIDVDLNGTYYAARAVLSSMIEREHGAIVMISSAVGSVGHWRRSAYCAAKGGVENLTRAMALDHGHQGIRVNCVAPGLIDTPLIRGGKVAADSNPRAISDLVDRFHAIPRIGRAEEVAAAVAFLASEEASFITGAVLPVDAGWTAH